MRSTRGRLLLAGPNLRDPNFFRAVVLMLDHDADGALGVVLNRPTDYPIASALAEWAAFVSEPDVVFVGGPVAPDNAIALGLLDDVSSAAPSWHCVVGDLGIVDLESTPPPPGLRNVRVFAGYSGWAAGQLESELAADAWLVLESLADDVCTATPATLWEAVLRRQHGSIALLASYPDEPAWN
jgi:putative transcriptional regulator